MALQLVSQVSGNGCFIAAVAMILGKTYEEAFKLIFPDRDYNYGEHGFRAETADQDIGLLAAQALERLGYKTKKSTYRQVKSLLRYSRKNTLIIVRWYGGPLCHAVVFDAETKKFLDPSGHLADDYDLKTYQRNLDSMYYVESAA